MWLLLLHTKILLDRMITIIQLMFIVLDTVDILRLDEFFFVQRHCFSKLPARDMKKVFACKVRVFR